MACSLGSLDSMRHVMQAASQSTAQHCSASAPDTPPASAHDSSRSASPRGSPIRKEKQQRRHWSGRVLQPVCELDEASSIDMEPHTVRLQLTAQIEAESPNAPPHCWLAVDSTPVTTQPPALRSPLQSPAQTDPCQCRLSPQSSIHPHEQPRVSDGSVFSPPFTRTDRPTHPYRRSSARPKLIRAPTMRIRHIHMPNGDCSWNKPCHATSKAQPATQL